MSFNRQLLQVEQLAGSLRSPGVWRLRDFSSVGALATYSLFRRPNPRFVLLSVLQFSPLST